ncbi:hypothetical protein M3Y94_00758800 [Aphelenchoides besseyi]|nr:hypothetical protein M3Y94_00758800 [Aphelenchoides besseyi]
MLVLADDVDAAKKHIKIIKQVHKQLYSLNCNVKSLIVSSDMPCLDLKECCLYIENFYQFKQVIGKHRIKGLQIENDRIKSPRFDETIDKKFFNNFPTCPSVAELMCRWKNLNADHDLVSKVTKMVPFFPNLRKLCCYFTADHYTPAQFSLQQLVVWIKNECKKLEELQKTKLPSTDMKIVYEFKIRKTESPKVAKQMVKEILKTTKFSRLSKAKYVTQNSSGYLLDKPYCDVDLRWLSLKFHAILKFTIDVYDIEPTEDFDD